MLLMLAQLMVRDLLFSHSPTLNIRLLISDNVSPFDHCPAARYLSTPSYFSRRHATRGDHHHHHYRSKHLLDNPSIRGLWFLVRLVFPRRMCGERVWTMGRRADAEHRKRVAVLVGPPCERVSCSTAWCRGRSPPQLGNRNERALLAGPLLNRWDRQRRRHLFFES